MLSKLLLLLLIKPIWGCEFPDAWQGHWFMADASNDVAIDNDTLGMFGKCAQDQGEGQFVVYNGRESCFRCLLVIPKHANVLNLKEGQCVRSRRNSMSAMMPEPETPTPPDGICERSLDPNSRLRTLVRLDGDDVVCPFENHQYTFVYEKDGQTCARPVSRTENCMSDTQMALRFRACPDQQTQSKVEVLTCKATWEESGQQYLMATLEGPYSLRISDQIRCFLYTQHSEGFELKQSDRPSCQGLDEQNGVFRTLTLTRDESESDQGCLFPDWLSELETALSFSFSHQYEFLEEGRKMIVSNFSYHSKETRLISSNLCEKIIEEHDPLDHDESNESNNEDNSGSYYDNNNRGGNYGGDQSNEYFDADKDFKSVKLVVKITAGCNSAFKVLRFFLRDDDVVEMKEGVPAPTVQEAKTAFDFFERNMSYVVLIKFDVEPKTCVTNGIHNVTSISLKGKRDPCAKGSQGFDQVFVQCEQDDDTIIKFVRNCQEKRSNSIFYCIAGWETTVPSWSLPKNPTDFDSGQGASDFHYYNYPSNNNGYNNNYGYNQRYGTKENHNSYGYNNKNNNNYGFNENSEQYGSRNDYGLTEVNENSNVTVGYMIARAKSVASRLPKRVCIIYTRTNDSFAFTVDTNRCRRNIRPGSDGKFRFTTDRLETCGKAFVGPAPWLLGFAAWSWLSHFL